jgi:hypothetical protein
MENQKGELAPYVIFIKKWREKMPVLTVQCYLFICSLIDGAASSSDCTASTQL